MKTKDTNIAAVTIQMRRHATHTEMRKSSKLAFGQETKFHNIQRRL
jgi:hypothetical protein